MPLILLFDLLLERRQALKWHADGVFDPLTIQQRDNLLGEEGAVHADLDEDPGQGLAQAGDALFNEGPGVIGIMHVAAAGQQGKDLAGLSNGA